MGSGVRIRGWRDERAVEEAVCREVDAGGGRVDGAAVGGVWEGDELEAWEAAGWRDVRGGQVREGGEVVRRRKLSSLSARDVDELRRWSDEAALERHLRECERAEPRELVDQVEAERAARWLREWRAGRDG